MAYLFNRLIPVILMGAGVFSLWIVLRQMEPYVQDSFLRWYAAKNTQTPVTLVLIDDETVHRLEPVLGSFPWSQAGYLRFLKALYKEQPSVMALDIPTSGLYQNHISEDSDLYASWQAFPRLVTGMTPIKDLNISPHHPDFYRLGLGVIHLPVNAQGRLRTVMPYFSLHQQEVFGSGFFPALSTAAFLEYRNHRSAKGGWTMAMAAPHKIWGKQLHVFQEGNPSAVQNRIPLTSMGELLLRWYQPVSEDEATLGITHPVLPAWRLFDKTAALTKTEQELLRNRIVLVGFSLSQLDNAYHTPISANHLGTDVHATAIDNLLSGHALQLLPNWLDGLIVLILFVAVFWMRLRLNSFRRGFFYTVAAMVVYLYIVFILLTQQNILVSILIPECLMLLGLFLGSGCQEYMLGRRLKNLSKMVPSQVYREIRQKGMQLLGAGGDRREITVMFVDIRNFTAVSEVMSPTDVTRLLNEFYTAIQQVVFAHQGTVDKFMGDGALILFGAPVHHPDHARQAMAAAQEILVLAPTLCAQWQNRLTSVTETTIKGNLGIGISIHTGDAFVGFLGATDEQLSYTAVGDTVNLCVRLQEMTKHYDTPLIVSETTWQTVDSALQPLILRKLDTAEIRGRQAPIDIYSLTPEGLLSEEGS